MIDIVVCDAKYIFTNDLYVYILFACDSQHNNTRDIIWQVVCYLVSKTCSIQNCNPNSWAMLGPTVDLFFAFIYLFSGNEDPQQCKKNPWFVYIRSVVEITSNKQ